MGRQRKKSLEKKANTTSEARRFAGGLPHSESDARIEETSHDECYTVLQSMATSEQED